MVKLLRVDPAAPDPIRLGEAARLLRLGGLVAFPTETVYGLGARALDEDAVRGIFEAKGRPATNPLIVHVASIAQARQLVRDWPDAADRLARAFWPGPLTLVLPRGEGVPDVVTGGLDTVAVRIPAHPVARQLLELAGVPVAAPSANRYTELSPTTAEHVLLGLGDRIDAVLDGGPCPVGIESTVVAVDGGPPRVLRHGTIGLSRLAEVVPDVVAAVPDDTNRPTAPGQARKHYSPRARLLLVQPDADEPAATGPLGRLVPGAAAGESRDGEVVTITLPDDPNGYAAGLYAALHRLDALGCATVHALLPPDEPAWTAVRDRLTRAASD